MLIREGMLDGVGGLAVLLVLGEGLVGDGDGDVLRGIL